MPTFSEYSVSLAMRDTFAKIAETVVDKMRPKYRYGTVNTVDQVNSKATVTMVGDTNPVEVNYGHITPYVGAQVRVNGIGTDKYIEDVIGGGVRVPVSGGNLNSGAFVQDGFWEIDDTTLASTLDNWPGQGIPTATTADANNPAGSYSPQLTGTLRTTRAGQRVIQEAAVQVNISGQKVLHFTRARSGDGVTWGTWRYNDGPMGLDSVTAQDMFMRAALPSRTNPIQFWRVDQSVPAPLLYSAADVSHLWMDRVSLRQASPGWRSMTWDAGSGVTDYGSGWPGPSCIRTSSGIILVRGLGTRGSIPANGTLLATLPAGYRPPFMSIIGTPATNNTTYANLRIYPNGEIRWYGTASGSAGFISLDFKFPAADVAPLTAWTPVTFSTGWSDYNAVDSSFPTCGYWQDSMGRVWFKGMCRRAAGEPGADSEMFSLPDALKPNLQIHQLVPASSNFASLHFVGASSPARTSFVYKVGNPAGSASWVSLTQLNLHPVANIPEALWRTMVKQNGWVKYPSASYPDGQVWTSSDGMTQVRGLLQGGTIPAAATIDNAPNDRMIYNCMHLVASNNAGGRYTFNGGAGDYKLTVNTGSVAWYSLDGFAYFTEA